MANTFTAPATTKGGYEVVLDWQYNGLPDNVSTLYVTTQLGEEEVMQYTAAPVYTVTSVSEGFTATEIDDFPHVYFYVTRHDGWDSEVISWRFESDNSSDGPVTFTATTALDSNFTPYAPDLTYAEDGRDKLLAQFEESTNLRLLLTSYMDACQDLETSAYSLQNVREIDFASGDRLDMLGEWVNVERSGRTDAAFRVLIRAELAILQSRGAEGDLITVLQLLLAMPTADIQYDEYFSTPLKQVYIRPRNWDLSTEDTVAMANLLRRAAPAGTDVQLIYSDTQTDDDYSFRFSDTDASTAETGVTHGFDDEIGTNGYGTLDGAS